MNERAFLQSRKQRENARLQARRLNDDQNDASSSDEEELGSDHFWKKFEAVKDTILLRLEKDIHSSSHSYTTASERQQGREKLQQIEQEVAALEELMAQASSLNILASADLKRVSADFLSLQKKVQDARTIVSPRNKFIFAKYRGVLEEKKNQIGAVKQHTNDKVLLSKAKLATAPNLIVETVEENSEATEESDSNNAYPAGVRLAAAMTTIENLSSIVRAYYKREDSTGQILQKDQWESSSLSPVHLRLRDLQKCSFLIAHENIGSMKLNRLNECVIVCRSVDGPIYVENCENCTLVLSCHQLRIHSSSNCIFIVASSGDIARVTLTPIIEDCHEMQFTDRGYSDIFSTVKRQMIGTEVYDAGASGKDNENEIPISLLQQKLHPSTGFSVKDFKWHNVKQSSPNWSIIEDENRLVEVRNRTISAFNPDCKTHQKAFV